MSFEFQAGKLIINLDTDVGDEMVMAALKSARLGILETLDEEFRRIARDGEVPCFRTENIKDCHRYLQAFETVLEYFGGNKWDS